MQHARPAAKLNQHSRMACSEAATHAVLHHHWGTTLVHDLGGCPAMVVSSVQDKTCDTCVDEGRASLTVKALRNIHVARRSLPLAVSASVVDAADSSGIAGEEDLAVASSGVVALVDVPLSVAAVV